MKTLGKLLAIALIVAAPVVSSAQENNSKSRAQVRAELVQLEQAGWRPFTGPDVRYPEDIQAAEKKVNGASSATGFGGVPDGTTASGRPAITSDQWKSLYSRP